MKIGQLVESYSCSFGRIIDILSMGGIVVKFYYLPFDVQTIYYSKEEAIKYLKFYNDDETAYVEIAS